MPTPATRERLIDDHIDERKAPPMLTSIFFSCID